MEFGKRVGGEKCESAPQAKQNLVFWVMPNPPNLTRDGTTTCEHAYNDDDGDDGDDGDGGDSGDGKSGDGGNGGGSGDGDGSDVGDAASM